METSATVATTLTAVPRQRSSAKYFMNVVWTLAVSEFKLRYFGSVLGYFWTLARPLMLFGVLYVVFTHFVRLGNDVPNYPLVLLTNIVTWTFFADATSSAVASLLSRETLIRKMAFPKAAIPISTTLTAAFNFALNLVAVLIFITISGTEPRLSWLEFPLIVLALVAFTIPLAVLLAILYVRFRDMQHIWDVALQLGFWGAPIIYTIETVPASFKTLIMCNPIAILLEQTRLALYDPSAPSATAAIGGAAWLAVPIAIFAAIVVLSIVVFKRESGRVAELL